MRLAVCLPALPLLLDARDTRKSTADILEGVEVRGRKGRGVLPPSAALVPPPSRVTCLFAIRQ